MSVLLYTPVAPRYSTKAHAEEKGGEQLYFLSNTFMFDPMSDLTAPSGGDDMLMGNGAPSRPSPAPRAPRPQGGAGGFAQDVHSITIQARQRTFYIDLKQSGNGKFFKVSEKSRGGQKTTIMFDVEDLDPFIAAFTEMKTKL